MPKIPLSPRALKRKELEAILDGLHLVAATGPERMREKAAGAMQKLVGGLPLEVVDDLVARGVVRPGWGLPAGSASPVPVLTPRARVRTAVDKALDEGLRLRLCYVDAKGQASERVVWPLGIQEARDGSESLVAWCEVKENYRQFKIDGIEDASAFRDRFPADRDEMLEAFAGSRVERGGPAR